MTTKRTVRITIDTSRLLIVLRGTSTRSWCQQCAGEVDMVPVESAAELVQVDAQTFQDLLAREEFHRSKPEGPVRICLNSLLKSIQEYSEEVLGRQRGQGFRTARSERLKIKGE